jgi:hypothetical protein
MPEQLSWRKGLHASREPGHVRTWLDFAAKALVAGKPSTSGDLVRPGTLTEFALHGHSATTYLRWR